MINSFGINVMNLYLTEIRGSLQHNCFFNFVEIEILVRFRQPVIITINISHKYSIILSKYFTKLK